jgi:DnaJ-domain-containing protein 1
MYMHNPLVIPILEILRQGHQELGEYDIIQRLEQQGIRFPVEGDSYEMALFRKHFLTMNALYQLQQSLFEDGYYLSITAVRVSLQPMDDNDDARSLVDDGERKVGEYYLDWSHYEQTGQQDVEKLLNDFWTRYFAFDQQAQALQTLSLEPGSSWQTVKARYRKLAGQHHPDRGGGQSRFIEIREAYEILRRCYQP